MSPWWFHRSKERCSSVPLFHESGFLFAITSSLTRFLRSLASLFPVMWVKATDSDELLQLFESEKQMKGWLVSKACWEHWSNAYAAVRRDATTGITSSAQNSENYSGNKMKLHFTPVVSFRPYHDLILPWSQTYFKQEVIKKITTLLL